MSSWRGREFPISYEWNCVPPNSYFEEQSHVRSNPTSKKQWLSGHRRAKRSYSTFKVRRGSHEKIPLIQDKEQRLPFAGAAVKRYPTFKVRETQVRR